MERRYAFTWDLLGDLDAGRPNLGRHLRVEVYRLMQFCLRDALETSLGSVEADRLFFAAGRLAGIHFYDNLVKSAASFDEFIAKLQRLLKDYAVGVLRVEEVSPSGDRIVLTVSEDLDCAGLPEVEHEVCVYDEGFLAGLLERFAGRTYTVKEVDCWCTGDRTCRFLAELQS